MKSRTVSVFIISILAATLSGCALLGVGGEQSADAGTGVDATATPPPTWTPITLAPTLSIGTLAPPTLTPSPTGTGGAAPTPSTTPDRGPTPLPEPTEIAPATATPEGPSTAQPAGSSGPNMVLSPQLGEPADTVLVTVSNYPPSSAVAFYWEPECRWPKGEPYYEDEVDEQGNLEIGLIVLPAARWPNAPPEEGDSIWLVAKSDVGGGLFRCAEFVYLARYNAGTTLVLTYTNTDYGYSIKVPNAWEWSWVGDDTSDVRFKSPSGAGKGFVRVINGTDVNAILPKVMAAEFAGRSYTTGDVSIGSYPGTQATTDNGIIVLFIPHNGRTYVLSFVGDSGQPAGNVMASFQLQ